MRSSRADGQRPFAIPIGGASVTGAAAYVWAADELLAQVDAGRDGGLDWIVVADGSGGTHAGLLAGLGGRARVLGVDVGTRPGPRRRGPAPRRGSRVARPAAARRPASCSSTTTTSATGYGAVTDGALEAIERVAAGSRGSCSTPCTPARRWPGSSPPRATGASSAGDTVVFWHTGGAAALFARRYADVFSGR